MELPSWNKQSLTKTEKSEIKEHFYAEYFYKALNNKRGLLGKIQRAG